jgi:hypothetical protein
VRNCSLLKELPWQTWRIQDRQGKAWVGVLVAIAIPDSENREMLFRVMPLDSSS